VQTASDTRAAHTRDPTSPPDASTLRPGLRLLPGSVRADIYRLYHVLRTLDDLVDEDHPHAPQRIDAVARWAQGANLDSPETRILSDLCSHTALQRSGLADFCKGMQDDIARAKIETEADFERYAQRAGGSVGIMLAQLLGTTDADGERKMAILGRAMQRTNILRDIDEDLAHDRLYISRETIERFGQPSPGARAALLRDQIARADELYEQALGALPLLARGRRGMALCTALYREILREIEREGFGSRPGRVVVPAWRRYQIIAKHRVRV
jgi:phytoene synthase